MSDSRNSLRRMELRRRRKPERVLRLAELGVQEGKLTGGLGSGRHTGLGRG
ncbi:MAG: hypothetical protein IIA91_04870, partial [Chloroflexi bacterium]|nr:hypothetical protein [Chloroflexota bacterium]